MPVTLIKTMGEFDAAIQHDKLVVIDFYADWCGPCRFVAPQVAELSEKLKDVLFFKVDIDKLPFDDISAVPTFRFFKSGKKIREMTGADFGTLSKIVDELK